MSQSKTSLQSVLITVVPFVRLKCAPLYWLIALLLAPCPPRLVRSSSIVIVVVVFAAAAFKQRT